MQENSRFPLNKIITEHTDEFTGNSEKVQYLFRSGLQQFLTIISALYIAGVCYGKKVPSGFTGKFVKSFTSPTLGGILDGFLLWISTHSVHPSLEKLSGYLNDVEKKGNGWLGPMVQMRNKYKHPQESTQQEIVDETIPMINMIPDFSLFGHFIVDSDTKVYWESDGSLLALEPLINIENQELNCFSEFKGPASILFNREYIEVQDQFQRLWFEIRKNDTLLENPDIEDIKSKLSDLYVNEPPIQNVWWSNEILSDPKFCRFIEPGIIGNQSFIKNGIRSAIFIKFQVTENLYPVEEICKTIGISPLKNLRELVAILKDNYLILDIETQGIGSKSLLSLLLWLADIYDNGFNKNVRVLIERNQEDLEKDHQKLWERLPDNLGLYFCNPPGIKGSELKSYFWNSTIKKKLFGIF